MSASKHAWSRRWSASRSPGRTSRRRTLLTGVRSTPPAPHLTVCLPFEIAVPNGVPLVVLFLALDQGDLGLDARALEIDREGHTRDALGRHRARPAVQLAPVEQQLAVPLRKVIGPGPRPVGRDVRADQERLSVPELDVG